jgi:hypothetical protein
VENGQNRSSRIRITPQPAKPRMATAREIKMTFLNFIVGVCVRQYHFVVAVWSAKAAESGAT